MEWGQQMKKHQQNARDAMYQNSNYNFERRERKTVFIKISNDDFTNSSSTIWETPLFEPLIIDRLSDVYLESFITHGCIANNGTNHSIGFLLGINEFNIKSNVASNSSDGFLFNKVLIPNEQKDSGSDITTIHKAKKLNYKSTLNPLKISKITGTLTTLDSTVQSIFPSTATDNKILIELVIIARD